mgnify:CR=1 FL=1
MVTYVGLMSFTEKGIQNIKGTTQRAAAAKEVAGRFGVNMREIFWTMGDVDMVCIVEAQDEKALTAFNLAIASQGNVRTQSLRAWTAEEMEQILAKMPCDARAVFDAMRRLRKPMDLPSWRRQVGKGAASYAVKRRTLHESVSPAAARRSPRRPAGTHHPG